jgi:hypothetical protein
VEEDVAAARREILDELRAIDNSLRDLEGRVERIS